MSWTVRARHQLRAAFRALPLETLATAIAVVSLWGVVARAGDLPGRSFCAAVVAVPLLFAVTILRRGGRVSARTAGLLAGAAALLAIGLGARGFEFEVSFAWRFGMGLLAATMVPFLAAAWSAPRQDRELRFADFVRRFSEETTASGLLLGAAILAITVLALSVQELFHLHRLFGMRVEDLLADAIGAVSGMVVLGYLYRLLDGGAPGRVPELWRRLIGRIAAPFLVAMLGVLVAYEAWVIARGALPKNLLSPLIVAAGTIGFASTLVIESLVAVRQERALAPAEPHPWMAAAPVRLSRAFAAVLLALLPLAMWALWMRIDQHGLTPMRAGRLYALGCLALLALWGTVRWMRRRRPLTWEVPAVTTVVALVASVGPLSVVDLSLHSQAARLEQVLDRAGVRSRAVLAEAPSTPVEIDPDDYDEAAERIRVLAELGGAGAVGQVLRGDTERCEEPWSSNLCLTHLGISAPQRVYERPARMVYADRRRPLEVADLRGIEVQLDDGMSAAMDHMSLRLSESQLVMDRGEGRSATVDLSPLLDHWHETGEVGTVPPLTDEVGCTRGHFLPRWARVERIGDRHRVAALEGQWLVPITPACP